MTELENRPAATGRSLGRYWSAAVLLGTAAGVAGNLLLFLVAAAAGVSFAYTDNAEAHQVAAGDVVFASGVPLLLGLGLALLVANWWRPAVRIAQVLGGGLAILTVAGPLSLDADTSARITLAAMHLMLGAAAVVTLEVARRAQRRQPSQPFPGTAPDPGSGPS